MIFWFITVPNKYRNDEVSWTFQQYNDVFGKLYGYAD